MSFPPELVDKHKTAESETEFDSSSSDDDEDWGGPRFATPPGKRRGDGAHGNARHTIEEGLGGIAHGTAMYAIKEGLEESTTSV